MIEIGLIGKKIGMTREFYKSGQSVPVTVIKFDSYDTNDKVKIARDYLLKKLYKNIGIDDNLIVFPDETENWGIDGSLKNW